METAEAEGIRVAARSPRSARSSYQAPEFYKKLGYEEYAVVEDWPRGHSKHAFRKRLGAVRR